MSPRDRILARRASFVAAALATLAVGCSRKEDADIVAPSEDKPKKAVKDAGAPEPPDAEAQVDAGVHPMPCLSVAFHDTGVGAMPCLAPPPRLDAGAPPKPCLKVAPPEGL